MGQIKQIIWDWNGTLLNDVEMCVKIMNNLLHKYALPLLNCEKYREVFGFPVKDYYASLGFDFEKVPFELVGHEFMDAYFKELPNSLLFPEVKQVLEEINKLGMNQLVLSAMEHKALEKSMNDKGILPYFSKVQGIDNHLASGKAELAQGLIESSDYNEEETLFVGDTLHDLEVAQLIGSSCILIANGHISKGRLKNGDNKVIDNLAEFLKYFQSNF